jgi:cation:H+ antiporter
LYIGVSEAVVGLSVVAVGTSLPELATAVAASVRREPDLVTGNVIGSNIFNVLCVLGLAAVISPLSAEGISTVDMAVLAGTAVYLWIAVQTGRRLARPEGAVLLAAYAAYMVYLY